jgi:hypothetical protein
MAGFCEHGNEHSHFIRSGKFLDHVSDYHVLKKISVPESSVS